MYVHVYMQFYIPTCIVGMQLTTHAMPFFPDMTNVDVIHGSLIISYATKYY